MGQKNYKKAEQQLILLFGLPRSGSSWLGKIFDSHPDTLYRHEPDSQRRFVKFPLLPEVENSEAYRNEVETFVNALPQQRAAKVAAKLPLFPKSYYGYFSFSLFKLGVLGSKLSAKININAPVPAFVNYEQIAGMAVVWKSIESLGRLGVLLRLLPETKSILYMRHPCGFVASVLRGESQGSFTSRTPSSDDWGLFEKLVQTKQAQSRNIDIAFLKGLNPVQRLAYKWVIYNEKAMDDTKGIDGCKIMRYEDLCQHPIQTSKALFEHTGLPWHKQTEDFLRQSTAVEKASYYSVFKNPLHAASKWKKELPEDQIEQILAITRNSAPGELYLDD